MRRRLVVAIATVPLAFTLAAPAPPPAATAPALGILPLIPIACAFVFPFLKTARLGRELTGEEISATTLMCFTGPLGYHIATEEGWIGPEFFEAPDKK